MSHAAVPTSSGVTCSNAFITASMTVVPGTSVQWPTGAGGTGLTRLRSGSRTEIGRKNPELTGMSGHRAVTAVKTCESVLPRGLLMKPGTCGLEPSKSTVSPSPATVRVILTGTSRLPAKSWSTYSVWA